MHLLVMSLLFLYKKYIIYIYLIIVTIYMGGAEVIAAWPAGYRAINILYLVATVYCATLLIYALLHIVVLYRQIALL